MPNAIAARIAINQCIDGASVEATARLPKINKLN
jgi:hypothetical protein